MTIRIKDSKDQVREGLNYLDALRTELDGAYDMINTVKARFHNILALLEQNEGGEEATDTNELSALIASQVTDAVEQEEQDDPIDKEEDYEGEEEEEYEEEEEETPELTPQERVLASLERQGALNTETPDEPPVVEVAPTVNLSSLIREQVQANKPNESSAATPVVNNETIAEVTSNPVPAVDLNTLIREQVKPVTVEDPVEPQQLPERDIRDIIQDLRASAGIDIEQAAKSIVTSLLKSITEQTGTNTESTTLLKQELLNQEIKKQLQ